MVLGEDLFDDFALYVGEAHLASVVGIGEAGVIEAEAMQHRGVDIVHRLLVLLGGEAEFVGAANDGASFDSTAGHPDGESIGIVVAAVHALGDRQAAEFAVPDDEGGIEETAGF